MRVWARGHLSLLAVVPDTQRVREDSPDVVKRRGFPDELQVLLLQAKCEDVHCLQFGASTIRGAVGRELQ